MELKVASGVALHGHGQRFNRTFMELKALRIMVFAQSGLFQSHLYGIESCVASAFHGKPPVSIAPLWN